MKMFHRDKIKPMNEKERYLCPFYGFIFFEEAFVGRIFPPKDILKSILKNGFIGRKRINYFLDQKGNQCALEDGYHVCQMERRSEKPNWKNCPFNNPNNEKTLKNIEKKVKVFPDEFNPKEEKGWRGISFKTWKKYVMKE